MTTTKRKSPPLAMLLAELRRQAEHSGTVRSHTLGHGARVAFKATETKILFSVSRAEKRVGDVEIETFKRDAAVPAGAERVPAEGQNIIKVDGDDRSWFQVGWKWSRP